MMTKKQIILRGLLASCALAAFGVSFNYMGFQGEMQKVSYAIETAEEAEDVPEPSSDMTVGGDEVTRARPSTGLQPKPPPPDYETELRKNKRRSISQLDRAAAIKKAEDLNRKLEKPDLPPEERESAEEELGMVLEEHFPPAAGEPEPMIAEEDGYRLVSGSLDINNIFNKVWGLFQGVILAWVGWKLNDRRKK